MSPITYKFPFIAMGNMASQTARAAARAAASFAAKEKKKRVALANAAKIRGKVWQKNRSHNDPTITIIINILEKPENTEIMRLALYKYNKITRLYPPKDNMNKMPVGKLCEKITYKDLFQKINFKCEDLDKSGESGSSYINDLHLINDEENINQRFSIKTTKAGGKIIIINKKNKSSHDFENVYFIIIHIEECKMYIFRHTDEIFGKYVKNNDATVEYTSGLITYLKNNKNYHYKFPELTDMQKRELELVKPEDPYEILYERIFH